VLLFLGIFCPFFVVNSSASPRSASRSLDTSSCWRCHPSASRSRCRFDGNHNQRGSLLRPESRFQIFFGKPSGPMGFRGSTSWLPLWSELFILPKYIFSKWLKFVLSNGFDNLSGCHTYLVIRFRKNAPITCILPNSIIRRLSKRIMI